MELGTEMCTTMSEVTDQTRAVRLAPATRKTVACLVDCLTVGHGTGGGQWNSR